MRLPARVLCREKQEHANREGSIGYLESRLAGRKKDMFFA